jgi:ABC-type transport system involved in multi-copper enzyme maturation permease subunit
MTLRHSSPFTVSNPLVDHGYIPKPGESGGAQSVGLVVGLVFGLLAVIAICFALWFILVRGRGSRDEEAEPDLEFDTETDELEASFGTEEYPSRSPSQSDNEMVPDDCFSDVFTSNSEESGIEV